MKLPRHLVCTAAALPLLLTACGGDASPQASAPPPPLSKAVGGALQACATLSTYQRYDVDVDPFSVDDGFSYATEGESYPDWGPPEDKGFSYQQMAGAKESHRTSSRSKSKGRHKPSSEALIANDELDYSPE